MSSVSVFVDDAVRGNLPGICAKTGTRANGTVRIEQQLGGIGAAWLLVFLGPIGWIVLIALAVTSRTEFLTIRVPMSAAAAARETQRRRQRLVAGLASIGLLVGAILQLDPVPFEVWLFGAAIAAVVAVAFHVALVWIQVGVELDASRRWVTLSRVHAAFVEAVEAWETEHESVGP